MNQVPSKKWLKIKEYRYLFIHICSWLLMSSILFIALAISNTQELRKYDSAIKADSQQTFSNSKNISNHYIAVFGPIEPSESFYNNINGDAHHIYISTQYEEDRYYTNYEISKDDEGQPSIDSVSKHRWETTKKDIVSTNTITIYDTKIDFNTISINDSLHTYTVYKGTSERVSYAYIPDIGYGTVFGYWNDGKFENSKLFMGMTIEEARNELKSGKIFIRYAGFMLIEFLLLAMFVPALLPINLNTSNERTKKKILITWKIVLIITAIADIVIFFIINTGK